MQPETASLFSPLQLAAFVGIAAFLLSIARNAQALWLGSKAKPDNSQLSESVVRLTAIVEQHQSSLEKLEADCSTCKRHQSGEIGKVYNKVDEVAAMVNRLCGKIDMLTSRTGKD
ncbi:MAG: hypothetical protein EOM72_14460 [Opitutae bacterium]|nr:hypothetical protein [Opitutae bacterium]